MPGNEEHSNDTLKRLGVRASDLHEWMDEPSKLYGSSHRMYRHDPDCPPEWALMKYGLELSQKIMRAHIELDHRFSGEVYVKKDRLTVIVKGVPVKDRVKLEESIERWMEEDYIDEEKNIGRNETFVSLFHVILMLFIVLMLYVGLNR